VGPAGTGRRVRREAGFSTAQNAVIDRLFVYGTLRSGQAARSLIANYVVGAERGRVDGCIYALPDGYPGFLPGSSGTVVGEVVTLRELPAAFALLDAYEGDEFTRTLLQVAQSDGEPVWAWCYVLSQVVLAEGADLVEGGDWAEYLRG
jgi:gamma-glutamylcyclotransferase (GGCT)/AIG2-like uncharacterized protein YtfP